MSKCEVEALERELEEAKRERYELRAENERLRREIEHVNKHGRPASPVYETHGSSPMSQSAQEIWPDERVIDRMKRLAQRNREMQDLDALAHQSQETRQGNSFQDRVWPWLLECFGEEIARDRQERNHRFMEESLELVQACGATASEAHQLVDYVFSRPEGDPPQEVGGVMVTLAALCLAHGMDMHTLGERELHRIWGLTEKIRAKQAAKPAHSPPPGRSDGSTPDSYYWRDPSDL